MVWHAGHTAAGWSPACKRGAHFGCAAQRDGEAARAKKKAQVIGVTWAFCAPTGVVGRLGGPGSHELLLACLINNDARCDF